MVYGGIMQRFARLHEIGGHNEFEKMMPSSKLRKLLVQAGLLLLPEVPERALLSRDLFDEIVTNEASAATHEFYATELVERGEAERWSTSPDEDFKRVGRRRLKELDEAAEYESIRDVPQENWQLYRYVAARQLVEAFEEAKVDPSMFFSESARLITRTIDILHIGYVARTLRIIAEGAGMQEAIEEALRPEDIEVIRRRYEVLFGRDVADKVVKGILSDIKRAFFMESPEQAFQQLCSETYANTKDLLYLHPFNRVFSESLILISEEDSNISISICIPADLKEYFDISSHLFPALLASKAMLLKLWKTASSEEFYGADLKNVEEVEVRDVTVEIPVTRGFGGKAGIFRSLAEDREFREATKKLRVNLARAAKELKVLEG
jgi:hypothetical protein